MKEQVVYITLKKGIFIIWTHSVIGWCEESILLGFHGLAGWSYILYLLIPV